MTGPPTSEPRYPDAERQAAYSWGWERMYHVDSLPFRDAVEVEVEVEDAANDARRCSWRAAALEGAARALADRAYGQRQGALFARAWRRNGEIEEQAT